MYISTALVCIIVLMLCKLRCGRGLESIKTLEVCGCVAGKGGKDIYGPTGHTDSSSSIIPFDLKRCGGRGGGGALAFCIIASQRKTNITCNILYCEWAYDVCVAVCLDPGQT